MKLLYVLRHAKSSWENYNQTDFERPLNERGLAVAPRMGELMSKNHFLPDSIVSSPAARARTTAEIIKDAAKFNADIIFDARIYEATTADLLQVLSETPAETKSLLFVGHNPGLEDLIRSLTGKVCEMPTAALAEVELEIESWKEIRPTCGKLRNHFKPKEIAD